MLLKGIINFIRRQEANGSQSVLMLIKLLVFYIIRRGDIFIVKFPFVLLRAYQGNLGYDSTTEGCQ